ncbi:MAG: hypothetical protein Q8J74_01245 [Candidatus Didemnitutus sp.]|nr:hypothetical protein [Candidatus Didemnitutus sp.]
MKTIIALLICACFSLALPVHAEQPRPITKEKALARLTQSFAESEVVVVAKVSQSGNRMVFTCTEVWKARDGAPIVGQIIEIDPKQKLDPQEGSAIVYFPAFPPTKDWYNALWLSKESLRMCPDLSLTEIRNALSIKKE